ncbi:hypothetical protein LVD15_13540 [Fulvivirga maritima]|nr:hypothetical protein [Fulvivirga maritima]UII29407.1 hypothetical protein LVD15_13540 [Fulvivirga maritima]
MKKLILITLLAIPVASIFSSCNEEEVTPQTEARHVSGDGSAISETGGF